MNSQVFIRSAKSFAVYILFSFLEKNMSRKRVTGIAAFVDAKNGFLGGPKHYCTEFKETHNKIISMFIGEHLAHHFLVNSEYYDDTGVCFNK